MGSCTSPTSVRTTSHDQARHTLKGERSGIKYQLGDHVRIKVFRVDIEAAKIDFTL